MFSPLPAETGPVNASDLDAVALAQRRRFLVSVRQPLVLVAQIQRSGGTLLTQLLDGHRALHVHHSELHIGKPKTNWPALDVSQPPAALFASLEEGLAGKHARSGYFKLSGAEIAANPNHRDMALPFVFAPALQGRLFEELLHAQPPSCQRDVLDAYVTSYFNAWIDYRGLYRDPRSVRYWAAFIAGFFGGPESFGRLRVDYPDGRVIVPVRDPVSWYASARAHHKSYAPVEAAISMWLQSNETVLRLAARDPEVFLFVGFEDLIERTEPAVRRIEAFLDLTHDEAAVTPTFNGMPVSSDSSFGAKLGIDRTALDRSGHVDAAASGAIRRATADVWRQLSERSRMP